MNSIDPRIQGTLVYQLRAFSDAVTVTTVFDTILGSSLGATDKATVFKHRVEIAFRNNHIPIKAWPSGWTQLTSETLAPLLG